MTASGDVERNQAGLNLGIETTGYRQTPERHSRGQVAVLISFIVVAVAGLYVVKWHPYYLKAHKAAADHKLGSSILSGSGAAAPAGWHAALSFSYHYGLSIWQALVLGLLVAAGIQELVPRDWLLRLFGHVGFRSTALASAAAIPSMMCTCCAAPATVSLSRSRASLGATLAYWLGNPVLNPATIVFMAFVLGWRWAILRIGIGVILVVGAATLANRLFGEKEIPDQARQAIASATGPADQRPLIQRYFITLGRLCIGLLPEYVVIVLVLGAVRAFLFPAMSPAIGHAFWLVIVLAIAGTFFVIPTAGEIPIVQTFMSFGLGAAGGAALMITLPAVSLPSLVMVGRAIPARALALVTGSVIVIGLIAAGLAVAFGL